MEVKEMEIGALKPYANNPRNNDKAVEAVAESIREFGFKVPIVIDKDGTIVAGHTRYKAAQRLGLGSVPCIVADDLTPEQVKAFRLADNRTAELADWDFQALEEELKGLEGLFDMEGFGFDMKEIESEASKLKDEGAEASEDGFDAEEALGEIDEPTTKPGDIWILGGHRLICGDSTKRETAEALFASFGDGTEKADLVFTDPPYGMGKEKDGVKNDNLYGEKLLDFNREWIPLSFEFLKDNGSWYCWGIDEPLMDIYSEILKPMIKANRITFRNLITWDKGNVQGQMEPSFRMYAPADEKCLFVMSGVQGFNINSDNYFEGWEPIRKYLADEWAKISPKNDWEKVLGNQMGHHYFTKSQWIFPTKDNYEKLQKAGKGLCAFGKPYDAFKREYEEIKREYYDGRAYFDNTHDNMNSVWHFDRTSAEERELTGGHATPKPIALCARAIKSSSREGETVLDLFGGSGSTLIACEQLGRRAAVAELDPKYCDVIVRRWETLTGKKAELRRKE